MFPGYFKIEGHHLIAWKKVFAKRKNNLVHQKSLNPIHTRSLTKQEKEAIKHKLAKRFHKEKINSRIRRFFFLPLFVVCTILAIYSMINYYNSWLAYEKASYEWHINNKEKLKQIENQEAFRIITADANSFYYYQQYEEAIKNYRHALRLIPESGAAHLGLAKSYFQLCYHKDQYCDQAQIAFQHCKENLPAQLKIIEEMEWQLSANTLTSIEQ